MILTRAQISNFEKAIAQANTVLPKLELLEKLAASNPGLAARVTDLRTKRDYLYQLAESALEFNNQISAAQRT